MKLLQKVLFSLLLATVIFTAFAVAAYSGLFDIIDQQYYNQRVRESAVSILEEAQSEALAYQRAFQSSVGELADVPAVRNVFLVNQSRQDTEEQAQAIGRFFENHPETDYIRIVDNDGGNLWYSTLESDIRDQSATRIEYRPISELDPPLLLPSAEQEGTAVQWVPERGGLRVTAPVIDNFGIPQGLLVVWANTSGLFSSLVSEGILGPSARIRLTPGGLLIFNAPRHFDQEDVQIVDRHVENDADGVLESDVGAGFVVEQISGEPSIPPSAYLVSASDLQMDESLRRILLASVFLVTFLLAYLILNIRQDPDVVVAERFRRFQQSVLK
ncbi:MAG: hypothetical protein PF508_02290, partial [Spirochaeta sp.]|nr:hypothetical protein [Spirochaeta sp.]